MQKRNKYDANNQIIKNSNKLKYFSNQIKSKLKNAIKIKGLLNSFYRRART